MQTPAKGVEIVEELPASKHPWKIFAMAHGVILANPEHPPRIVRQNGDVEILKPVREPIECFIGNYGHCKTESYVARCASKLLPNRWGKS